MTKLSRPLTAGGDEAGRLRVRAKGQFPWTQGVRDALLGGAAGILGERVTGG